MENNVLDSKVKRRKEKLDDDIRKCVWRYDKTIGRYEQEYKSENGECSNAVLGIVFSILGIPVLYALFCTITCFTNCDAWNDTMVHGDSHGQIDNIQSICIFAAVVIGLVVVIIFIFKLIMSMQSSSEKAKMIEQAKENEKREIDMLTNKYNQDIIEMQANYNLAIKNAKELFGKSKNTEKLLEFLFSWFSHTSSLQDTSQHIKYIEFSFTFIILQDQIRISNTENKYEITEFQRLLVKDLKSDEECEVLAELLANKLKERIIIEIPKIECNYEKVDFNGYQILFKFPNDNYVGIESW